MSSSAPDTVTADHPLVESYSTPTPAATVSLPPKHPGVVCPVLPGHEQDDSAGSTLRLAEIGPWQRLTLNWWFPPVAMLVIAALLGWTHLEVLASLKDKLRSEFTTIVDADVTALETWLQSRQQTVKSIADSHQLRSLVTAIYAANHNGHPGAVALRGMPEQQRLREFLEPIIRSHNFRGFTVVDVHHEIIASEIDDPIGTSLKDTLAGVVKAFSAGRTLVTPPFESTFDYKDEQRAGDAVMFAVTPIRDVETNKVIAGFALRMQPNEDLARILSVARPGETGDVYLFAQAGVMLTRSRHEEQLRTIGLLQPAQSSTLNIPLRDPEVDMTNGRTPDTPVAGQRLIRSVAHAISGEDGVDVDGYRDYRGVHVVGAWRWLPEHGMGVVLEQGVDEAWKKMLFPMKALWIVFGLVMLFVMASLFGQKMNCKLRNKIGEVKAEVEQLGQYRLERLLGEGGMGAVYRASHALLRRPTAIKLIRADRTSREGLARFEREVQMTARLTHPNTIAVYDYGRTPDGVFYYAMELLPGLSLQQLVQRYGPQPASRVIHIMLQICGSLAEAHSVGLIHRDVKPANVMLCNRGGVRDLIKVLDFGLVKSISGEPAADGDTDLTRHDRLIGTPLYMSPQQLLQPDNVDERADVWSVGAVGYFLLAGQPVMEGHGVMDIISWHMQRKTAMPPSRRAEAPHAAAVPADLEALILGCLEHEPGSRPSGMEELIEKLEKCANAGEWSRTDAIGWWQHHRPDQAGPHEEYSQRRTPPIQSSHATTTEGDKPTT